MFDIKYGVTGELIPGIYKTTICRIYYINDDHRVIMVGEGRAYWNNEHDKYDLKEGQRQALKRAVEQIPNSLIEDFYEWVDSL